MPLNPLRCSHVTIFHAQANTSLAMAYPFPRLGGSPQTPHFLKGMETPRRQLGQLGRIKAVIRGAAIAALTSLVLLAVIRLLSHRQLKQLDRIPFAESQLSECVTSYHYDTCLTV